MLAVRVARQRAERDRRFEVVLDGRTGEFGGFGDVSLAADDFVVQDGETEFEEFAGIDPGVVEVVEVALPRGERLACVEGDVDPGDSVALSANLGKMHLFDDETGTNITY
jgi:hypothetical protein